MVWRLTFRTFDGRLCGRSFGTSPVPAIKAHTSSQFLVEASRVLSKAGATGEPSCDSTRHGKKLRPFALERYLAVNEFQSKYLLSCSDATAWSQSEILAMADAECYQLWNGLSLQYTESLGHPLLLDAVYQKYRHKIWENSCSGGAESYPLPESYFEYAKLADSNCDGALQSAVRILECIPAEGILMSMMALLHEGDRVIVQGPAYQSLQEVARSRGCNVVEWRPSWDDAAGFWRFDLEELAELMMSEGCKMLVLNSPHNPTGCFFTQEELQKIVESCGSCNAAAAGECVLFVDEMYIDILQAGDGQNPAVSAAGLPNSVVLSGLSKPAGLPGLRTGWLLVENRTHFAELCQVRDYTTICPSAPSEILSLIALRNEEKLLQRSRKVCARNLELLQNVIEGFPSIFKIMTPLDEGLKGCMTVFVPLNANSLEFHHGLERAGFKKAGFHGVVSPEGIADAFCDYLLREFSLCAVPGSCFGFNDMEAIRFGLGRVDFLDSLQILREACSQLIRN